MKVYISGKITGDINYKLKFWMVAAAVHDAGHTPLNPVDYAYGIDFASPENK